jgi:hypothetical protein
VAGGRLGPVGQHAGQAAVAGDPGRPRAGRVQDLADQVVGEPVAGTGVVLDQQAGGQGTLGAGGGVLDRQVEQAGHDLQVEGGPDHHRRPQQRLDLGAGPPGPGLHRVPERRRDRGPVAAALGRRPQALHREQGVAPGPLQHRPGQVGHAEAAGQLGHGGRRERAQLQHRPGAGQGGERLGALLGPDARQHQHTVAVQAARHEVEELKGGGAREVEVVDGQQQRLLGGQAADEGCDGLERPPPLQLRRGPLVAGQVQQPAEVRHQLGQGPGGVAGGRRHPPRGRASAAARTASATGWRNSDRSAS